MIEFLPPIQTLSFSKFDAGRDENDSNQLEMQCLKSGTLSCTVAVALLKI